MMVSERCSWCCLCSANLYHYGGHQLSPSCNLDQEPMIKGAYNDIPREIFQEIDRNLGTDYSRANAESSESPISGDTPGLEGQKCAEDWPPGISFEQKARILTIYRALFIKIGKCVCMLPQTVARICGNMGSDKMCAIHRATMRYCDLTDLSHSLDEVNCLGYLKALRSNWSLQADMMLTMKYLTLLRGNKIQNIKGVVRGLCQGEETEEAQKIILSRLLTLQQEPFMSNQQIARLASIYCTKRTIWAKRAATILEWSCLPEGWGEMENFFIERAAQSFVLNQATAMRFKPLNVTEHPQVMRALTSTRIYRQNPHTLENWLAVYNALAGIISWLPFFALRPFRQGKLLNTDALLAEFSNHDEGSLLLTVDSQEVSTRVTTMLERLYPAQPQNDTGSQ